MRACLTVRVRMAALRRQAREKGGAILATSPWAVVREPPLVELRGIEPLTSSLRMRGIYEAAGKVSSEVAWQRLPSAAIRYRGASIARTARPIALRLPPGAISTC